MSTENKAPIGAVLLIVTAIVGVALLFKISDTSKNAPPKVEASKPVYPDQGSSPARILQAPNGGVVMVFRNRKAFSDAIALIEANAASSAIAPYISCIVPSGTPAARVESGMVGITVVVSSGVSAGCRGWVPLEFTK